MRTIIRKKGELSLAQAPSIIMIVGFVFLIMATIAYVSTKLGDSIPDIEALQSNSLILNLKQNSTLSPIGEGINSYSATAKNDTWLYFNNSGYVNLGNSYTQPRLKFDENSSFSISLWFNATSIPTDSNASNLIGKYLNWGLRLANGSNNLSVGFGLRNNTGAFIFENRVENFSLQQWYHVTIVYLNKTNATMYIDGILNKSVQYNMSIYANLSVNSTTTNNLVIGGKTPYVLVNDLGVYSGNPIGYNGTMDEIRIYNRTLTSTEVSEIYNSGRLSNSSLPIDQLVLWLSFNEGMGNTVYDKSIYSINGTKTLEYYYLNDGVSVGLVDGIDYRVNKTNGFVTTLSNLSDKRFANVSYEYFYSGTAENITRQTNDNLTGNTDLAGILLTIGLVGIILTILIGVFVEFRTNKNL